MADKPKKSKPDNRAKKFPPAKIHRNWAILCKSAINQGFSDCRRNPEEIIELVSSEGGKGFYEVEGICSALFLSGKSGSPITNSPGFWRFAYIEPISKDLEKLTLASVEIIEKFIDEESPEGVYWYTYEKDRDRGFGVYSVMTSIASILSRSCQIVSLYRNPYWEWEAT